MDNPRRSRRRLYRFGEIVRTGGIYIRVGGPVKEAQRVALSIGERFPPAIMGWNLEERLSVQRPALDRLTIPSGAPEIRPILLDAAAMEYALEIVHRAGWNGALRELEAEILASSKNGKTDALALISELRIGRTMPEQTEGDLSDG